MDQIYKLTLDYIDLFPPSFQVTRAIVEQFGKVSKGEVTKEEVERAKYVDILLSIFIVYLLNIPQ